MKTRILFGACALAAIGCSEPEPKEARKATTSEMKWDDYRPSKNVEQGSLAEQLGINDIPGRASDAEESNDAEEDDGDDVDAEDDDDDDDDE